METIISINLVSISFFAAIVFTGFFRTLSKRFQILIDLPNKTRKLHHRPTPLVGGLGIHFAMLFGFLILIISVDTKIYDRDRNLQSINSSIEIIGTNESEKYNFSASKIPSNGGLSKNNIFEINIEGIDAPIKVFKNEDNHFELIAPDGTLRVFSFQNGKLTDLNDNNVLEIKEPEEAKYFSIDSTMVSIIIFGIIFQLIMLLDDLFGLSQIKRLLIQSAASVGVISLSGEYITNVGFQILNWDGSLGSFGIFFTIFAVTGVINAFNMIDGINGLCSGIVLIIFIALSMLGADSTMSYANLIIISSLSGFLVYNLGLFGRKRAVFLGDNGSNFLGFITAWSLITYSSEAINLMNPVTALWMVAIPLWDCIGMIFHRISKGRAAFEGDREHIHHVLFDRTSLSGYWPLIILLSLNFCFALLGIAIEEFISPLISLLCFICLGVIFLAAKNKLFSKAY